MRINHPRSSNPPYRNLSAHSSRHIDHILISGGERISSTERQLIEAVIRAITEPPSREPAQTTTGENPSVR